MASVTLKIDLETKNHIIDFYQEFSIEHYEQYVIFYAKYEDVTIKIYQNKNNEFTALFSGKHALEEAKIFDQNAELNIVKDKEKTHWLDEFDQIGSDEVGVGDLFGPTIVVATFIKNNDIPFLRSLNIDDSKKLTDKRIREIAPKLMEKFTYATLIMSNKKLNDSLEKGLKKLELEAKMHNQAQLIVYNKIEKNVPVYLDQFLSPITYSKYLGNMDIVPNLHFKTKGESYYPSIAVSSIIARYKFLLYMDDLNNKYQTKFPFGAGKAVDDFLIEFSKTHKINEIETLVKKQFINYKNFLANKNNSNLY